MSQTPFNNADLLAFLDASPTPYHAVSTMSASLLAAGFVELKERDAWTLQPGGRYFVVREGSSIIAFTLGHDDLAEAGWRMVGAHTDSPCLRVKPNPELHRHGFNQLAVDVYGGALLNPWFDRDLGLAGRVNYRQRGGAVKSTLINLNRPVGVVPSLAIHLDREANNNRTVNPQTDMPVVLFQDEKKLDFRQLLASVLAEQGLGDVEQVLDYELSFYDCQGAAVVGWQEDFIASARLDNLLSCYLGLQGLLNAEGDGHRILVCNDHEEVGSQSAIGAQGPMLESVLRRIAGDEVSLQRAVANSMMISADNAHGIHPNYSDKHDANHGPRLNGGPVIKINVNQRYATSSETSGIFRNLCSELGEAVQSFVVRADMACGSTIGPITASGIGIRTLDIGVPTFAMHSIRELAGSRDSAAMVRILAAFYQLSSLP
ncbi:M18 family aminopeptidase [Spongiibacter taiwanensis]|uniref:M18 family aminopeptidase n=1 Tax=Spongiibacter taiwanensis TaxID=1748242 RepID=UPI002034D843|nr:M18 family aminopeptidase [Spongiibacter taiwanensis]USA43650.1 M18 family aminopeptidase [Spongiibacter taiwanensis]